MEIIVSGIRGAGVKRPAGDLRGRAPGKFSGGGAGAVPRGLPRGETCLAIR